MRRANLTVAAVLLLGVLGAAQRAAQESRGPGDAERQRALTMFARAYYPGRSGQIMIVPREGSTIISHDEPIVRFMHGSPWRYDTRIPLIFYGANVRPGTYQAAARQEDVMPTVARVLDLPAPPTVTGRPLAEALTDASGPPPRAVVLAVLDGMRLDYFDTYAAVMPTLSRLRHAGAWFVNMNVDSLPSITGPGHATIGSGTEPRFHGVTGNSLFDRIAHRPEDTFAGNSPRDLMVVNLADAWNLHTRGRAVIVAQGSSVPSAVALAGHGACLFGASPIRMVSYSRRTGAWTSNESCYLFPDYLRERNTRELWEAAGGKWMGHDIADPDLVKRTSLFSGFEMDALIAMIEREGIAADEVPDLVLVNLKTPDYVGHAYGPDSPELREALTALDRQFARLIETLDRRAPGRYLLAMTADHGMPAEPPSGSFRVYTEDIVKRLHERFDPAGRLVLHYEPENSQLSIDLERLSSLGRTPDDLVRALEQEPFVFAAFTEDEVRRAAAKLPAK
jgi:predicted AlkP superfamily pyrophosphatase or phosphodiesterase